MDQERDRLKHLLIILLEALSVTPGEGSYGRNRIQEKVADAGLDEADVNGLLDWIENGVAPGHQLWAEIKLVERSSVGPAREEVMWLSSMEGVAETLEQGSVV